MDTHLNHLYAKIAERVPIRPELLVDVSELMLGSLIRRLHYSEAAELIAELPEPLAEDLYDLPAGPNLSITPQSIRRELSTKLGLSDREVDPILEEFYPALFCFLDSEKAERLLDLLPDDFKALFQRDVTEESAA